MPKALNISRGTARLWKAEMPNSAWISIFEPDDEMTIVSNPILNKFPNVKLGFKDHRDVRDGGPTMKEAHRVLRFIDEHLGKTMIVNCAAGISRSGAICKFLHDVHGYTWPEAYKDRATPNMLLLELLLKAHEERMNKPKWHQNWFSNMLPFDEPLEYEGITYLTPENFYQAMKIPAENHKLRREIAAMPPHKAKTFVRNLKTGLLTDETYKRTVMSLALHHKFNLSTSWGKKLLETGDEEIIEWSNWGDKFWGKDLETKEGANNLGKMLMIIRGKLRLEQMLGEATE